jgi:hypothetical protein
VHDATPSQKANILYAVVKLRLPDQDLILKLTEEAEASIDQLGAKDIALVAWALARTKLSNESPMFRKLKDRMLILIKGL